ncbi:hypothetical protein N0V90_000334 [Kalmusia sp. IMI 367209]|nr:hypothetical protein N0V90_000334 [Kalmusia sp. IMI 367209]
MLLPSLITLRHPASHALSPEDIFESSLGGVFVNDLQNQHGDDPNTVIVYRPSNKQYKELEFRTADVNGEEQRRKFAHYLWNAGILVAELVAGREALVGGDDEIKKDAEVSWGNDEGWKNGEWWTDNEEEKEWSIKGEKVTITDYPAQPILETITANVSENLPLELRATTAVHGHQWGDFSSEFADAHAHRYTRILAADCLWMPYEHENLARSMLYFLSESPEARVYVIAGFHTGRAKLAPFFEEVVPEAGLEIEDIYEMNAEGKRRAWSKERDGGREDVGERKKWLVLARLRRAAQP